MKTVNYDLALSQFREHCERNFGRPTKDKENYGWRRDAGRHYGIQDSQIGEILKHSRGKRMSEQMLADIGLKYCNVIVKVKK